jgi:hypothetical protein
LQEGPTFKIVVTEDYQSSTVSGNAINAKAVLVILTISIILFCVISLLLFAKFKRPAEGEFEALTESEEKYLAIMDIRKKIRKLVKSGDAENVDEIERLQVELAELKAVYLQDIMDVLDTIVYVRAESKMDIDGCQICMEAYMEGGTYMKIPGCNHVFCKECTRNWFDSKNQEREQRCPFCNLAIDIAELRARKQAEFEPHETNQVTPMKRLDLQADR